ncbi:hypothetical protein F5X99DRAFT_54130 [Biscogniauxia marginata]|nr:hypothetical protein F5X99DRAFT_54130 [Biscogniauxia marginata]
MLPKALALISGRSCLVHARLLLLSTILTAVDVAARRHGTGHSGVAACGKTTVLEGIESERKIVHRSLPWREDTVLPSIGSLIESMVLWRFHVAKREIRWLKDHIYLPIHISDCRRELRQLNHSILVSV